MEDNRQTTEQNGSINTQVNEG